MTRPPRCPRRATPCEPSRETEEDSNVSGRRVAALRARVTEGQPRVGLRAALAPSPRP